MKTIEVNLEGRLQVWAAIGPLMLVLTSLVCLIKGEHHDWLLISLALVGLPLCWRWKMSGLFGAVTILLLYLVATYSDVAIGNRFWHVGTTMAAALGLVVTTLSFEEVEALIGKLRVESESRLKNLWSIDEKFKAAQKAWQEEREDLSQRLQESLQELREKEARIGTFGRVLGVVRQDLDASQRKHERLLTELFEARTQASRLSQELDKEAVFGRDREICRIEGMYRQLRHQFEEKTKVLADTRKQLFYSQEKCLVYEKEKEEESLTSLGELELELQRYFCCVEAFRQQHEQDKDSEVAELTALVEALLEELSHCTS